MFGWMIDCQRITEIVSESLETPPTPLRRLWMWVHLLMCGHCAEFRNQVQVLRAAGCDAGVNPGGDGTDRLSDDARARLQDAIRRNCG